MAELSLAKREPPGLQAVCQMAASSKQASHDTVSFVYEHFLANQLNAAAGEMAEDMIERNLATSVAHATIQEISMKSPG
jgi:hypothetical protein